MIPSLYEKFDSNIQTSLEIVLMGFIGFNSSLPANSNPRTY